MWLDHVWGLRLSNAFVRCEAFDRVQELLVQHIIGGFEPRTTSVCVYRSLRWDAMVLCTRMTCNVDKGGDRAQLRQPRHNNKRPSRRGRKQNIFIFPILYSCILFCEHKAWWGVNSSSKSWMYLYFIKYKKMATPHCCSNHTDYSCTRMLYMMLQKKKVKSIAKCFFDNT